MNNYITHLHVRDTGIFEQLDISFNRGFNFIVGPNGSGKTSILKCIALALSPADSKGFRYGEKSEVWFESVYGRQEYRVGLGKGWVTHNAAYREASGHAWVKPPEAVGKISSNYLDIENKNINITPLIMGAYRRIEYKRIEGMLREDSIERQRKKYHSSGFANIVGGTLPNVKQWLINRYFQIDKEWAGVYKRNWQWILKNLRNLGPANCSLEFKHITRNLEPMLTLQSVDCYLEEISAGFQSILSLVFAIVEWIETTNNEEEAYIADATGSVIIDELDVHLHPEWQLTIREALAAIFPNLQFIVTTHSPQLIASAKAGELIVLPKTSRRVEASPQKQHYAGWSTDEILEGPMGVTSLANKEYIIRINQALDYVEQHNIPLLEESIRQLKNIVHPSNTILNVLNIKLAQLKLEQTND